MAEGTRANIASLLRGINRYNPENLAALERYVDIQVRDNTYDLEANLAVLKLYQFNPGNFQTVITAQILLKALTNLPHTDFTLCKCLIEATKVDEEPLSAIVNMANFLETCNFREFWAMIAERPDITLGLRGFDTSIRKFICHVVAITYQNIDKNILADLLGGISEAEVNQWIAKYGWKDVGNGEVFIGTQEESIKTKNITENITFESVAGIMATVAHSR